MLADVLGEKLSPAYVRREYGVVLDPSGRAVDYPATQRLRADLAAERGAAAG